MFEATPVGPQPNLCATSKYTAIAEHLKKATGHRFEIAEQVSI
jgi:hypothetical protein